MKTGRRRLVQDWMVSKLRMRSWAQPRSPVADVVHDQGTFVHAPRDFRGGVHVTFAAWGVGLDVGIGVDLQDVVGRWLFWMVRLCVSLFSMYRWPSRLLPSWSSDTNKIRFLQGPNELLPLGSKHDAASGHPPQSRGTWPPCRPRPTPHRRPTLGCAPRRVARGPRGVHPDPPPSTRSSRPNCSSWW